MSFNIEVESGKTVKLPTAEKYCDRDIVVTAFGGGGGYTEEDLQAKYDEGKQAEYDRFWDAYQKNGTRALNNYLFYTDRWTDENYNPKYDILCSSSISLFYSSKITDTKVAVDCVGIQAHTVFAYCHSLHTIRKFVVDAATTYDRAFLNCSSLENLTIEGVIGQNGVNLQWSAKLSPQSIAGVVDALSVATSGLSVTLSQTAVNNAFTADEWAALAATKTNWTINLV